LNVHGIDDVRQTEVRAAERGVPDLDFWGLNSYWRAEKM